VDKDTWMVLSTESEVLKFLKTSSK
jgi:hypothetical protein